MISEFGYCADQVFMLNEGGLVYKATPKDPSNERISFALCSNLSDTLRLRALLVGNEDEDDAAPFTSASCSYFSQEYSWLTPQIFAVWFHDEFVPCVREHLAKKGLERKALLLIDFSVAHHQALVVDEFNCVFLPGVITHQSKQGVEVESILKRNYRRELFRCSFGHTNENELEVDLNEESDAHKDQKLSKASQGFGSLRYWH